MAVTQDRSAPYAPPSAIIGVIRRFRDRGLPTPISAEVLQRASVVQDSLIPRTLQALQTLDLIEADGQPTETLEGIRKAPEAEYKTRVAEWLTAAYSEVLCFVNPAHDNETKVRDAFRPYKPIGQQDRMVILFIGLFNEAGIGAPKPEKAERAIRSAPRQPAKASVAAGSFMPRHKGSVMPVKATTFYGGGAALGAPDLPPALAGLLSSLPNPPATGWTRGQRDKFIATFEAVLDFVVPIVSAKAAAVIPEEEEVE